MPLRLFFAFVFSVLMASLGSQAEAADVPVGALAPIYLKAPVASPPSWTGFYVGGDIGGKWIDPEWSATSLRDPPGVTCPGGVGLPIDSTGNTNFDPLALRFGIFAGVNWQIAPTWIVGIEGDYGYSHTTFTHSGLPGCTIGCLGGFVFPPGGTAGGDQASVSPGWDASLRARLGYLVTPTLLVYGTGGIAWQGIEATGSCGPYVTSFYCIGPPQPDPSSVTKSAILTGWTVGAGAEWRFSPHWTLRGEYRFSDFNTWNSVFAFGATPGGGDNTYRFQLKVQTQIGTLGLAYLF